MTCSVKFFEPTTTAPDAPARRRATAAPAPTTSGRERPAAPMSRASTPPRLEPVARASASSPSAASASAAAGIAPARIVVASTIDRPRKMYSPRPPAPIAAAIVAVPTPTTLATRMPGDDRRHRQRQLHHRQQLPRRHAHRDAGFDDRRVDAAQPGGRGPHDRQQGVEGQRHQRRARPDAADERQRQQEPQQRQARDRLRHAGRNQQGLAQPWPPHGQHAGRHADRDRDAGRDQHQHEVLRTVSRPSSSRCASQNETSVTARPPVSGGPTSVSTSRRTRGSVEAAIDLGPVAGDESAVVDDADALAERERLGHVVRDQHHGRAELGPDPRELARTSTRVTGSSAPNGSSISRIGGSTASARARPTRCRSPPDSSRGKRGEYVSAGRPTSSSSARTRSRARWTGHRSSRGTTPTLSPTVMCGNRPTSCST